MVQKGLDDFEGVIWCAVYLVDGKIPKYLVEERGADVDGLDGNGNRALHYYATRCDEQSNGWKGAREMLEFLIEKGSSVNQVNKDLETPLH